MKKRCLFLTSCGLTDDMKKQFFDVIEKSPRETKILFIPTAALETDGAREGIAICLYELSLMGIPYENIVMYNLELILSRGYERTYSSSVKEPFMLARLLNDEEIKMFDAVFVGGGDASVLCREMARTGFDKILEKAINDGLVYVEISAGSMYAAGNLADGLHIIDNPIIPHCNGERITEFTNSRDEIRLSDGHALYITEDSISMI